MSKVLKQADKPAVSAPRASSVHDAVRVMVENRVGAVVILDGSRPIGIFTERDVMTKVVLPGLDPKSTPVVNVMTTPVVVVAPETESVVALRMMLEKHIRHLPVVDLDGSVLGMLSIRHVMQFQIEELKKEVGSLEAYTAFDGAGG